MTKSSKIEAGYGEGAPDYKCALCTMFIKPHGCRAVAGKISPNAVCNYFRHK